MYQLLNYTYNNYTLLYKETKKVIIVFLYIILLLYLHVVYLNRNLSDVNNYCDLL